MTYPQAYSPLAWWMHFESKEKGVEPALTAGGSCQGDLASDRPDDLERRHHQAPNGLGPAPSLDLTTVTFLEGSCNLIGKHKSECPILPACPPDPETVAKLTLSQR